MADFNKEELNILANCIVHSLSDPKTVITDKMESLVNKIESMLDNYCEHENLKDVGKEHKVCRGCGAEIYDNQ